MNRPKCTWDSNFTLRLNGTAEDPWGYLGRDRLYQVEARYLKTSRTGVKTGQKNGHACSMLIKQSYRLNQVIIAFLPVLVAHLGQLNVSQVVFRFLLGQILSYLTSYRSFLSQVHLGRFSTLYVTYIFENFRASIHSVLDRFQRFWMKNLRKLHFVF